MKKILLISFEYPIDKTYCGGVGQIVKKCRGALQDLGYEVYVLISSKFQKRYPVKLLLPDATLVRYPNFYAFQREHDWRKFDYVVQHFVNWTKELKKIKRLKGAGPKIIYHFHSILRRERDSGFKIFNHFLLNQEKMIEIADKIVCPSQYEYDNFLRYFPYFSEKVAMIENTIEIFPSQEEEIQNIRSRYGIEKDDIVSIYVGRLERIKGAHILAQHLPAVLKKHRNIKIFIIGKALERNLYRDLKKIQKRFSHQLFYLRYLEKSDLFQYYYLSHIYINISLSESFSLTTYESALCNNTLLLNRLPVFDRFKEAALFFSHQDTNGDGFISKYEYLIKNKMFSAKLAKKSTRIAKEFLSKDKLKEDLSALLQSF